MLAVVNTPNGNQPVEIREVPEPEPAPNEALVEVRAFSLNRGELRLFQIRPEGWRPGQDIGGVVIQPAANGNGPEAGARVVALADNAGWAERAAVPGPAVDRFERHGIHLHWCFDARYGLVVVAHAFQPAARQDALGRHFEDLVLQGRGSEVRNQNVH